jgi:hypothetical protein
MRLPWPSGGEGEKSKTAGNSPEMCPRHSPGPPIEEGGGGRHKGVSCCPRTLSCARVWGACGTINLSADDALDVLQISCRSRARSREGFSRGWAEAHPHPGPYRVATSCGSHRWRDFFSRSAHQGQGNRIWRDCCLSLRCHSRASGNPAPQNPSLALDSRLRGNDGNREVEEPKCDCPAFDGGGMGWG